MITLAAHPLLDAGLFVSRFPAALEALPAEIAASPLLLAGLRETPPARPDVELAVRALLRHGGFKPSGRSKPASEYLVKACAEGTLGSINAAVDACNVVSLASGLPISVVDLDRVVGALAIDVAPAGSRYVFNPSGQEIDVGGLISLFDAEGPCAGPVKDGMRTKTQGATRRTLSVVWGTRALPGLTAATVARYRALLAEIGVETEAV